MRTAFAAVTKVAAAAEQVWNEIAGPLDAAGADLGRAAAGLSTLGDEALAGEVAAAQAELARLRGALNTDPLAFWSGGRVVISPADKLRDRATAAAARAAELGRLRDGARRRIAEVTAAAAAARTARSDAAAGWERAAAKIAASALPPPPAEPQDLSARLAALDALLAAGRWTRCWPQGAGPAWSPSWISSHGSSRPLPANLGLLNERWLNSWADAMSCAGCSARTRRRQRAWAPCRIRCSPRSMTVPASCCGRRPATWPPRRPR
jgi:hypothetical protein